MNQAAAAATTNDQPSGVWSQSLFLSVLAGASTCLGAAVVLVRPRQAGPLRKAHLAAALSLAGSVMVTVSFFSLLPEALEGSDGVLLNILSWAMLQRVASFAVGAVLYGLLSKCAFPEPEAILGFQDAIPDDSEEGVPLVQVKKTTTATNTNTKKASLRIRSQASSASTISKDDEPIPTVTTSNPTTPSDKERSAATGEKNASSSYSSWWSSYSSGQDLASTDARRAWRVTWLLFISLAVHNFPEGLAVAASSLHSPHLGITTAMAIGYV